MKKILITGENSYIGTKFKEWIGQWPDEYQVDEISVRGDEWKEAEVSSYDSIFHVAGIAHNSSNPKLEDKYFQVNRDLTIEVAKKVKSDGVKQFIFMSSIIVYGTKNELIDENTKPDPDNFYGESKLQAEQGIVPLQDENFNVAIIRPPMIYGKGSKGNYPKLAKLAKITPIFPDYQNKRSMLFIDNLIIFLNVIVDKQNSGVFHPQNKEYVQTSNLVQEIGKVNNHKVHLTKLFNPIIKLLLNVELFNKLFGDLYYKKQ